MVFEKEDVRGLVTFLAISVAKMVKMASAMLTRPIEREIVSLVVTIWVGKYHGTDEAGNAYASCLIVLRLKLFCMNYRMVRLVLKSLNVNGRMVVTLEGNFLKVFFVSAMLWPCMSGHASEPCHALHACQSIMSYHTDPAQF